MKYYCSLQPFKLISFDLDDTLYDNSEVIRLAELNFVASLQQESQIPQLDLSYWQVWKKRVEQQDPLLCEDVVAWRLATIRQLLTFHGKSAVEIEQISAQSMDVFVQWRHKVDVPQQSFTVLTKLKPHFILTVITNGNVEPERIGFDHFDWVLRGGEHGRAKPHGDLFWQTAQQFNLKPEQILHVGDNLVTDVQGAIQAGCQAVWLNLSEKSLKDFPEARLLPTLEMTNLDQLLELAVKNKEKTL